MLVPEYMTFLIADDEETMCNLIRTMLKSSGFGKEFHFAPNGVLAFNILKKRPIDFAIIDWNMPTMNGTDLLYRIREDKALRDLPVVMVTGESNMDIIAAALESEIDGYIVKPLSAKSFVKKIKEVIERANNPSPFTLHLAKADILEDEGNIDGAIDEIKLAMRANSKSSKPITRLGALFLRKNDLKKAERWFTRAVMINECDVSAYHKLGLLYLIHEQFGKAIYNLDKALELNPRHLGRAIELGQLLIKRNQVEKAITVFDRTINASGDPISAKEDISDLCIQNGIWEYSKGLLDSIIKQDTTRYDIMFKLGLVNEKLGQPKKALGYFDKVRKKTKDNAEIMLHLARNYLAVGEEKKAKEELRSLLKADPDCQEAKELLFNSVAAVSF